MIEQTLPENDLPLQHGLMPLLPLRDVVVYPHLVIPLFVGRAKSVKALEIASDGNKIGRASCRERVYGLV